jgi:uncharacterized protein YqfB (UPF0267 family)
MTEVRIPFLRQFREPMLSGKKTWTSRTRKYGEVGDTFPAFGATFQITEIRRMRLKDIVEGHFREEGLNSVEEAKAVWIQIHPRKLYAPDWLLQVHVFKKVKE